MKKAGLIAAIMAAAMLAACGDTADNTSSQASQTGAASDTTTSAAESTTTSASETAKPDEKTTTTAAAETTTTTAAQTTAQANATTTTAAGGAAAPAATTPLPDFKPVKVEGDQYAGTYVEQTQGAATMEVTNIGNGTYSVHIVWPVSTTEVNTWDLTGSFSDKGTLSYTNCRKTTSAFDANGNYTVGVDGLQTPFTVYSTGAGTLERKSYGIQWTDTMGDILAGTTFIPVTGSTAAATYEAPKAADAKKDAVYAEAQPQYNQLQTGLFYDGNGNKSWIDITTFGDGTYYCTLTAVSTAAQYDVWTFSGKLDGNNVLNYTDGTWYTQTYDEAGNIAENTVKASGQSGNLKYTNTGLVWTDLTGGMVNDWVFVNDLLIK